MIVSFSIDNITDLDVLIFTDTDLQQKTLYGDFLERQCVSETKFSIMK